MNPPTILIVEDDDFQYEIYEEALAKFHLLRVSNGSEALAQIPGHAPDLLILDHVLSQGELGLDFLPEFKELLPFVPIIIVSGALEVHQQMGALQGPRRAHYCLTKPVDIRELKRTVETALKECGERKPSGNSKPSNAPTALTRSTCSAAPPTGSAGRITSSNSSANRASGPTSPPSPGNSASPAAPSSATCKNSSAAANSSPKSIPNGRTRPKRNKRRAQWSPRVSSVRAHFPPLAFAR